MMTSLIVMRLLAACLAVGGAIFLAYHGKDGWRWLIVCAIILGSITASECGK